MPPLNLISISSEQRPDPFIMNIIELLKNLPPNSPVHLQRNVYDFEIRDGSFNLRNVFSRRLPIAPSHASRFAQGDY